MSPLINGSASHSNLLLSVCIPAYNAQAYIGTCLGSLAAQTFRNFEVVIVDDGSEERLVLDEKLVASLGAEHVHLDRTKNCGAYAARQRAATLARGDYVFFVDADDELFGVGALEKLADVIQAHRPDVVLFDAVRETGERLAGYASYGWQGELCPAEFLGEMILHHRLNSLCCMAFRRELLAADECPPHLSFAEDRLQKFEVVRRARIVWVLDEPLYLYKESPTSTTRALYRPEYYLQACYTEERMCRHFDELGIDWAVWAESFIHTTCGHLLSMVRSAGIRRSERLETYAVFRELPACKMALARLGRRYEGVRLHLWVEPFKRRHFGVLDVVLVARGFASR